MGEVDVALWWCLWSEVKHAGVEFLEGERAIRVETGKSGAFEGELPSNVCSSQIDLALGDEPVGKGHIVGYGKAFAVQ